MDCLKPAIYGHSPADPLDHQKEMQHGVGELALYPHERSLDLGGATGEASQKRTMRFCHSDLKRPTASNRSPGNSTNAPDAYKTYTSLLVIEPANLNPVSLL